MSYANKYKEPNLAPVLSWINLTGSPKSGKTDTLLELAKYIPTLHIDFEAGTRAYKSDNVVNYSSEEVPDFFHMVTDLLANKEKVTEQICILDPFSTMTSNLLSTYKTKWGCEPGDYKSTLGNGWNIYHNRITKLINDLKAIFPLVITVTHMKSHKVYNDSKAIMVNELDLIGGTKTYVEKECDTHLTFLGGLKDGKFRTRVLTASQEDSLNNQVIGSRKFEFVKRLEDSKDFIVEVSQMFGKEVKREDLFKDSEGEIKFTTKEVKSK